MPTLRVLKILELVDQTDVSGVNLTDISNQIGVPKGTLSPILRTLVESHYIKLNNDTGRYTIGFRAFELGLAYGSDSDLLSMIQQRMRELVSAVSEICQLGVLMGPDVFYLLKENPDNAISIRSNVGSMMPAYATGLGKALLSGKPDDWIRQLYHDTVFEPFTPHTLTGLDALLAQVKDVRTSGMAFEQEESKVEICCQAVPLVIDNQVRAALSVTVPKYRYTEQKRELIGQQLMQQKKIIESVCQIQHYDFDF